MANIASSKKDARRSASRAVRNRGIKSAVKTRVSKARRGVAEGAEDVTELAERAISSLDRAAAKGVLHPNNAARRKSRLARRLNATSAAGTAETAAAKAPAKRAAKAPAKGAAKPASKASNRPATRSTASSRKKS